jgi:dTDP-4-dehydrorhamnose reductase
VDYPEVDFTDLAGLRRLVEQIKPQVIVNAAAYTAVDLAEKETDKAHLVNALAPGVLAEAARSVRAGLVHYSTDYVFDGEKGVPYQEADATHPLNAYGATKLAGEQAVLQVGGAELVFRTSWVYSNRQGGFVTKVLQWSRQQPVLKMVTDQVSGPTWARCLAEITSQVLAQAVPDVFPWMEEKRGLYHLAGSGYASRLDWAQAILKNDPHPEEQQAREILPALTAEFPTPAVRPLFSALDCSKFSATFHLQLPDWKDALSLSMQ